MSDLFPLARDVKKQTDAVSIPAYITRINHAIQHAITMGAYNTRIDRVPNPVCAHCVELLSQAGFHVMESYVDGISSLLTISWASVCEKEVVVIQHHV
jgi:hypothetical protein